MKNLKLPIVSQQGEITGEKAVPAGFFGVEAPLALTTQSVRVFLSNQRRARAKAKSRGEVAGSGAKIWRQKGTGRARHGDRQAPIFVGGGKAFGPTGTQNYHLKLSRKMAKKAILSVLSQKLREKKAFLIEDLKISRTKEAFLFVETLREKFSLRGEILFVCGKEEFKRFFRNLADVRMTPVGNLNTYLLLHGKAILLTAEALTEIVKEGDSK